MNLVALTESLRTECGASGQVITTVQSVYGETLQLTNWIIQAWKIIQELHPEWSFLRTEFSKTVTSGQRSRTLTQWSITDLAAYNLNEFTIYETAVGTDNEQDLHYESYLDFKDEFLKGTGLNQSGRPHRVSVDEDDTVWLGPNPDTGYTIKGAYQRTPQILAADADEPAGIKSNFHDIIVSRAMMMYGAFNSAAEVYDRGKNQYNASLFQLENKYMPQIRFGSGWGS